MTLRKLTPAFPVLRERDGYAGRTLRAELLRRVAHAQNYLYSNLRRVYSNGGSEGNGYQCSAPTATSLNPRGNPYFQEKIPNGRNGVPVARFLCPPNWGASQRLKVQGSIYIAETARVVVSVEELDGRFTGIAGEWTDADTSGSSVVKDWSVEVAMPGRLVQVTVWVVGEDPRAVNAGVAGPLWWISARYREANAAELFGDTPRDYQLHLTAQSSGTVRNATSMLDAWVTRTLVRNTLALWGARPREVFQSFLGFPGLHSSSTGILTVQPMTYKYYVPKGLATVGYRIQYEYLPGTGTTSITITVKRNGSTVATHATLTTSGALTGTFSPGTSGNEDKIEISVTSAGGSVNDHDAYVSGVWMWEEAYDLGSVTAPTDYKPLDESQVVADAVITYGTAGAGDLAALMQNDTWLYKHRTRGLVGDWCRRVYKRVLWETPSFFIPPFWDWTRWGWNGGTADPSACTGRNITVCGDSSSHDDVDALTEGNVAGYESGGRANAYTTDGNGGWLATATWRRHGRRLMQAYLPAPSGLKTIRTHAKGRVSVMVRGRRLETWTVPSSSYTDTGATERMRGAEGPRVERTNYRGQASFRIDYPKTSPDTGVIELKEYSYTIREVEQGPKRKLGRTLVEKSEAPDAVQQWLGPVTQAHAGSTGGDNDLLRIRGRCPEAPGKAMRAAGVARVEGMLFEVELNQGHVEDVPLGQDALDTEPAPGALTF